MTVISPTLSCGVEVCHKDGPGQGKSIYRKERNKKEQKNEKRK